MWFAKRHFGAEEGNGCGPQGLSYAVPTKDEQLRPLKLERIAQFVTKLLGDATNDPDGYYYVTALGTGLAGYTHEQIAPLFAHHPPNVLLPAEWDAILYDHAPPNTEVDPNGSTTT